MFRPLKIVLLNQFYFPDRAPTSVYLDDLASSLVRRGHCINVICSQRKYNNRGKYVKYECINGVKIYRVPFIPFRSNNIFLRAVDSVLFYLFVLYKILQLRRIDAVLSMTSPPWIGVLGKIASIIKGSRHICWIMDLYPNAIQSHLKSNKMILILGPLFRMLTQFEFMRDSRIITIGYSIKMSANSYRQLNSESIFVVPLWPPNLLFPISDVDRTKFRESRGWSEDHLIFMYSGNMGLGHRFIEFLNQAISQSLYHDENNRLLKPLWVFSGSGSRLNEVKAFKENHPMAPIHLMPLAPPEMLSLHLSSADVHLISLEPSWNGVMIPSKLQAVFQLGCPSIFVGSPLSEPARWITNSASGWVVQPGDTKALESACLESASSIRRKRFGLSASKYANSHFDRNQNIHKICYLIEQP